MKKQRRSVKKWVVRIARDEAKERYDECTLFSKQIQKEMDQLANTFGKSKVKQEGLGAQLDLLDWELFGIDFIRKDSKPKNATQTDISDTQSNEPVTEPIRIDKPSEPERMEEGSTEQMDVEHIDQILSHETSWPTKVSEFQRG